MKEYLSDGTSQKRVQGMITIEKSIFTELMDKICFLCNKEEGTNKYKYHEDIDTVTNNSGGQDAITFLMDFLYRYPYLPQRDEITKRKSELSLQAKVLKLEERLERLEKD